jgi:hypothetical protein
MAAGQPFERQSVRSSPGRDERRNEAWSRLPTARMGSFARRCRAPRRHGSPGRTVQLRRRHNDGRRAFRERRSYRNRSSNRPPAELSGHQGSWLATRMLRCRTIHGQSPTFIVNQPMAVCVRIEETSCATRVTPFSPFATRRSPMRSGPERIRGDRSRRHRPRNSGEGA